MSAPAVPGGGLRLLPGLLPYLAAAFVPALTPARALLLAWLYELGRPAGNGGRAMASFGIRHGTAWLLLHYLRPDASWLAGAGLLVLALGTLPWWSCVGWRRGPAVRVALTLALVAPAGLGLLVELSGRDPGVVRAVDPWQWAAEARAASFDAARAYREGAPPDRPEPALLALRPPARMHPAPLEESPQRGRALVLLAALLALQAVAVAAGRRRVVTVLYPALLFPWAGALLAAGFAGMQIEFQEDSGTGGRRLRLEVHDAGADLWDPLRGELLPPSRPFVLRPEREGGLLRVVSQGPWAVVREPDELLEGFDEPAAWLELHPLRAPRSGGPAAGRGGLGVLRLWAAAATAEEGGARWELAANGRDLRRLPLP